MADLSDFQAAGFTRIVGSDSVGNETNAVGADSNLNMKVIDFATSATGSAVPSNASMMGAKNPSNNLVALLTDASSNLLVNLQTALPTGANTIGAVNQGSPNTHTNAWFQRLTDGTNDSKLTASGDLQVADIINVSGQYRAQSVTTTAAEALGAATILANRKMLSITPTNGTVYWGYSNTVTTSSGAPIFKNQTVTFAIGSNVHIYLIGAATVDCRIAEGS